MQFSQPTPMLGVADVQRAIGFYRDALGFQTMSTFEPDGQMVWASMRRGASEIMFTKEGREGGPAPAPGSRRSVSLYIRVDDVVGLHQEVSRRGFAPSKLIVRFYQMKEFELRDPEGYNLIFGQNTDEPPTPEE